jgi:membrane-associated phospholipid phosphatase
MDGSLYLDVNHLARDSDWAHGFLAAYALWGGLVALVLLVVIGWWRGRSGEDAVRDFVAALLCGVSAFVALALNGLVSNAVARPRPFVRYPHAEVLLARSHDLSFPSDHCAIAGALVGGLMILDRRLGLIALPLALLLAFARVYAGVHYPSDVIAGLALGSVTSVLVWLLLSRPAMNAASRLLRTPFAPLIVARRPTGDVSD